MQKRYTVLCAGCLLLAASLGVNRGFSQIPNPGFESWSGGNPVSWLTTNSPPSLVNVTQASPGRTGSFAVQGTVVAIATFAVPVVIISGPDGLGYPNTTRPAALHGWYKYTSVSGDIFNVIIGFQKNGTAIGAGAFTTAASQSTYREFIANIFFNTGDNPDTAIITAQIANSSGLVHAASVFTLDDLAYGAAGLDVKESGAGIPQQFSLQQNYPNPFNPSTTIRYALPKSSHVTLKVFNVIGQEVVTLVDGERTAGVHAAELNAANMPSGTYFYRLTTSDRATTKPMVLLK